MAQEANPVVKLISIWDGDELAREHMRVIWPEFVAAMDQVIKWSDRVITKPASVRVPPMLPPGGGGYRGTSSGYPVRPPSGGAGVSSAGSAGRSGQPGTQPTSGGSVPVQMPLFDPTEEEK